MNDENLLAIIGRIVLDVTGSQAALTRETTASDVDGWDSLAHIRIILAIEEELGIKFEMSRIGSMLNVGDLMGAVEEII